MTEPQYSATLPVHCGIIIYDCSKRNDTNHCSCVGWGRDWRGKHIITKSDNESRVRHKTPQLQDETLMHMLHCLFFIEAHFRSTLVVEHTPGVHNELADAISCYHATIFFSKVPGACRTLTSVPQELYRYICNCILHVMIQYIHISSYYILNLAVYTETVDWIHRNSLLEVIGKFPYA